MVREQKPEGFQLHTAPNGAARAFVDFAVRGDAAASREQSASDGRQVRLAAARLFSKGAASADVDDE
jgi:hypothetical protein